MGSAASKVDAMDSSDRRPHERWPSPNHIYISSGAKHYHPTSVGTPLSLVIANSLRRMGKGGRINNLAGSDELNMV